MVRRWDWPGPVACAKKKNFRGKHIVHIVKILSKLAEITNCGAAKFIVRISGIDEQIAPCTQSQ
jgi:hypothetical protein